METNRVDLGDGEWADFCVRMRHGTAKKVMEIYRPFINTPEIVAQLEAVMEDRKAYIEKLKQIVGDSADDLGANERMILGQVKAWSFGEVSQAVLDDLPPETVMKLMQEADRRYNELPLAESGARK
jgi:hypothetical protein